jgi:hypothetical protein
MSVVRETQYKVRTEAAYPGKGYVSISSVNRGRTALGLRRA